MKKKILENEGKELKGSEKNKMSRKAAIKKTGYIAASAATLMILLGTPKNAAASPAPPPSTTPPPSGGSPIWK